MAKTESTAVTRLIELSQQRAVQGDFDWFTPPRPRRIARDEVTQVVRLARRAITVSPSTVAFAFLAGVLTVGLTTLVNRASPSPSPSAVAPVPVPVPVPVAVAPAAVAVTQLPEPLVIPAPVALAVAEPEPVPAAPPRARPAATAPAALAPRVRAIRPASRAPAGPLAELRINSKPPCELYIDGRSMGWTPQRGISVAPGRHTIIFRNRDQGVERKVLVDAKVGEVHRLIRDFTEP